jgi:hypothetical protein
MALPGLDLRDGVQGLFGYAQSDLRALWQQVQTTAQAQVALHDVLPALIETYGAAAAVLAANWYDELREKFEVRGSFLAIPADVPDTGAHALAGWASTEATDLDALQSLVLGGMQRRIANFSRLTISGSSVADPQARGWQRTGNGECAFCRMLIGRGAVYTEASADFASHDHCRCSAVPAFTGASRPVRAFTPSERNTSEADRARVREYLRTH